MITVVFLLSTIWADCGRANEPLGPLLKKSEFAQRLSAPHSGVIEGKPLRIALLSVANSSANSNASTDHPSDNHINLWLDRKVDPGQPVSPGALGPTRYAALTSIASQAGCVCYPVDSCVVIGRPIWVAAVVQAFGQKDSRAPKSRIPINVHWPALTTPTEAAAAILGNDPNARAETDSVKELPHDLWPSNRWHNIDGQVAFKLLLCQFLSPQASIYTELAFSRSYRFPINEPIRSAIQSADPESTLKSVSGNLRLQGNLSAHTTLCKEVLSQGSSSKSSNTVRKASPPGDTNDDPLKRLLAIDRTFTISIKNKPAGAVLSQLLSTAGINFSFSPEANLKAQQMVSLSAEDETLGSLVLLVAKQAGLKLKSTEGQLQFTP